VYRILHGLPEIFIVTATPTQVAEVLRSSSRGSRTVFVSIAFVVKMKPAV